jgi:hypothetical protein
MIIFGAHMRRTDVGMASAPGGTRTPSLLIRSQPLYPLSYGGLRKTEWNSRKYCECGISRQQDDYNLCKCDVNY